MKYFKVILPFVIFSLSSINLSAQNGIIKKYSILLDIGVSRTFHYNQPVNLNLCFEGCFPENQNARIIPNANFSLYRDLNERNSLKIGLGVSSYKFWEEGMAGTGGGTVLPYEATVRHSFYGASLGYRHIFNTSNKVNLFIENDFIYEIPVEDYTLIKSGVAIQPKIGVIMYISNNWSFIANGFYKTAIVKYSQKDFDRNYIPFAYGLQLGVNLKI